jgi:hypothetical protein
VLPGEYAVCQLPADASLPAWVRGGTFYAVVATPEELSIVCAANQVPPEVRQQAGWRLIEFVGPFDFALTGILASVAAPLAEAGISMFALATFDTDYILIGEQQLTAAISALQAAGHRVEEE